MTRYSNTITNGEFKGMTLRELYNSKRVLFGNLSNEEFPILFKIIEAADDLSIQVHPNDEYAKKNEDSYGKSESWYILDAVDLKSKIIMGHNARSKSEFLEYLNDIEIFKILNERFVSPGEYFFIPSGTIHGICKNTKVLEISQSSDITYRIFDYNRLNHGKNRELHIDKALDVLRFPSMNSNDDVNDLFSFEILINKQASKRKSNIFGDYIYVVSGRGSIDSINIKDGDFIMVSSNQEYKLSGQLTYALVNILDQVNSLDIN